MNFELKTALVACSCLMFQIIHFKIMDDLSLTTCIFIYEIVRIFVVSYFRHAGKSTVSGCCALHVAIISYELIVVNNITLPVFM